MDSKAQAIRDEVAQLLKSKEDIDRQIRRRRVALLKALPESLGYETADSLIMDLAAFASPGLRTRIGGSSGKPEKESRSYDADVRARVRHALEVLHQSIASVSEEHGPSVATITKWKREWGLSASRPRKRSHSSDPPAAANGAGQ
jgi:hypothetical protein